MAKTRNDLVNRALAKLGVAIPGNAPQPEDVETIDSCIDTTIERLRLENVYSFASSSEFDDAVFDQLALCVAVTAGPEYGQPAGQAAWDSAKQPLWLAWRINRGTGKLLEVDPMLRGGGW